MSVVTGAVGSLGPKLLKLLHDEYKLQKDVKKQVQSLSRELDSIYAFLHKVSDVPWHQLDDQVKLWACEVREASYDMEDVIDTFLVRVDGGKNNSDISSLKLAMTKMGELFSKAKARRDIATKIKDITKRLEEVTNNRQKYKLEIMCKPHTTTSTIDPRLKAMYKEVTQLLGVDKSRAELMSMLSQSQQDHDASNNKKMKTVSVVGVGGLGKTTLAKAVYDKLRLQYDYGAFISIGREHDLVRVFKDILFHLDGEKHKKIHNTGRGVDLLIHQLREFLKKKRYFIVIDDVWEVRTREAIELALVDNNNDGSKVITTTRNLDVAKASGEVYKLKPLSYDDSMKLFHTRLSSAYRKLVDNKPDDIPEKILKKCAGIPLAIITMASLFAGKPESKWSMVYNSIGFHIRDNREAEDTMKILSFSYYDLPTHLRSCLLYLSTYPEDYLIGKESLIRKWIAEGFINGDQGTRLFDLGESSFNDFVNRSLIQIEETWDFRVSFCRVHDMVLDLIRKLSYEENFIAILDDNVEATPELSNVRRLANQNRKSEHIDSEARVTRMPKVRSYTTFLCSVHRCDQFLGLKLLRVLDIVNCNFKEGCHLEHLGDLLHLRYLGISCQRLPQQIGNLKLLQTLDVIGTLPASIVHLTELVRLCTWNEVPDGIGKLVSLEELRIEKVICRSYKPNRLPKRFFKELGSLRELRVLEFGPDGMDESRQREFVESLNNMQKIQYILVSGGAWNVDTAMWEAAGFVLPRPLQYLGWSLLKFSKFPSCINPSRLPNLSQLRLAVTTMDDQDLNLLARLPALCHLYLETDSTVTASNINASDGSCFQKLMSFQVNKMVHFEQFNEEDTRISLHIWNGKDAMPFASRKSNDSKKVIPSGVMPNLELLNFGVPLRALKENNSECGNMGLEYLPSLRQLGGWINYKDVTGSERDAAWGALRDACKLHPNNPTFHMSKYNKKYIVSTHDKEDEKQREEEEVASQTADTDLGKLSPTS